MGNLKTTLIFIFALSIQQCYSILSFTSNAKTCQDCHKIATCKTLTNYVACSCPSGYVGNGFNCTALVFCSSTVCCPQGYVWNNEQKTCLDVNECNAGLDQCASNAYCTNFNGIYLCKYDASIQCPTTACSSTEDCVKINGVMQCVDPCTSSQQLDGASRLYTIDSTGRFLSDRFNFGWFKYSTGYRMKEGSVGPLKCGSLNPLSLGVSHQTITQTVQTVRLWVNTENPYLGPTIQVKACPGGQFVYKLSGSLRHDVYCTEKYTPILTTKPPGPSTASSTTPPPGPSTDSSTTPPPEPSTYSSTTPPSGPSTDSITTPPPGPSTDSSTTPPPETSTDSSTTPPPEPSTESSTTPPPEPSTDSSTTPPPEPSTDSSTTPPPGPSTDSSTTPTPGPSTDSSTTSPPEPSTESSTTPPPEPSTDSSTTPPSEPSTDSSTTPPPGLSTDSSPTPTPGPSTDSSTTPPPEPSTESSTTPPPEPSTDSSTTPPPEPSTDSSTTPLSEPSTDSSTTPPPEPSTDSSTTPPPEPSTDSSTTLPPGPSTDASTTPPPGPSTDSSTTPPTGLSTDSSTTPPPEHIKLKISIFSNSVLNSALYVNLHNGGPFYVVLEAEDNRELKNILFINSMFENNDSPIEDSQSFKQFLEYECLEENYEHISNLSPIVKWLKVLETANNSTCEAKCQRPDL